MQRALHGHPPAMLSAASNAANGWRHRPGAATPVARTAQVRTPHATKSVTSAATMLPPKEAPKKEKPQQPAEWSASSSYSDETESGMLSLKALYSQPGTSRPTTSNQAGVLKNLLTSAKQKPQSAAALLALLHELGEHSFVVDYVTDSRMLDTNQQCQFTRDIALSLAFSHIALAAPNESSVEATYLHLEKALTILARRNAALDLQAQLQASLQSLAFAYVEEVLSHAEGPAGFAQTPAQRRTKALTALRVALWGDSSSLTASERLELLAPLRPYLSAAEQIALYGAAPKGLALSDQELYDTALAHIATAVTSGWPHHVLQAHSLLQRIESQNQEVDVSLERSVCELLLGRRSGQPAAPASPAADPVVHEADASASHNGTTTTDGGQGWAQSWLQLSVLPNFSDTAGKPVDLSRWHGDPKVAVLTKVLYGTNAATSAAVHAADSLAHISSSSRSQLWSLWQAASQQVQHVQPEQVASTLMQQSKAALTDVGPRAAAAASAVAAAVSESPKVMAQAAQRTLRMVPFGLPNWQHEQQQQQQEAGAAAVAAPAVAKESDVASAAASVAQTVQANTAPAASTSTSSNADAAAKVGAAAPNAQVAAPAAPTTSKVPITHQPQPAHGTAPLMPASEPAADSLWMTGADGRIRPRAMVRVMTSRPEAGSATGLQLRNNSFNSEPLLINPFAVVASSLATLTAVAGVAYLVIGKLGVGRVLGLSVRGPWAAPQSVASGVDAHVAAVVVPAVGGEAAAATQQALESVRSLSGVRELTRPAALQLLQAWFTLRAQWLGASHASSSLASIADGKLRKSEVKTASAYRSTAKHLEGSCVGVEVLRVDRVSGRAGEWTVLAAVQESGVLRHKATTATTETFEQSYRVQYTLRHKDKAGWRIVDATVQPALL